MYHPRYFNIYSNTIGPNTIGPNTIGPNTIGPNTINYLFPRINIPLYNDMHGDPPPVPAAYFALINDLFNYQTSHPTHTAHIAHPAHPTHPTHPVIPSSGELEELNKGVVGSEELEPCPICMCDLKEGDKFCCLPCGHHYHEECINTWFDRKNTCPNCRFPLLTGNQTIDGDILREQINHTICAVNRNDKWSPTVKSLKNVLKYRGVDISGCVEKSELLQLVRDNIVN